MQEIDLSREGLLERIKEKYFYGCLMHAEEAIRNWDNNQDGFETVRDLFLKTIFSPRKFQHRFSSQAYILESSIERYKLMEHLIEIGKLERENIEGKIIDIG